jgi:Holliday junction resolvase YEN1
VSTQEQAFNLRGLRGGWKKEVNLPKLRTELRQRYDLQTREFLKHIAPILLVKALVRCRTPEQRNANTRLDVASKATSQSSERKVSFNPLPLLPTVDISLIPEDENWSKFEKKGTPYDPLQKIECLILECILLNGLAQGTLDVVAPTKRKSKNVKVTEEAVTALESSILDLSRKAANRIQNDDTPTSVTSSKRQNAVMVGHCDVINPLSKKQCCGSKAPRTDVVLPLTPSRPTFRRLQLPDYNRHHHPDTSPSSVIKPLGTVIGREPDLTRGPKRPLANVDCTIVDLTQRSSDGLSNKVHGPNSQCPPCAQSRKIEIQKSPVISPPTVIDLT